MKKTDPKFKAAYDRAMLRSGFLSLFWSVFADRKRTEKLTLEQLAKRIGSSKHEVSRWFNGDPNWTINTIASIAGALNVTLKIEAIDSDGRVFSSSGVQVQAFKPTASVTASSNTAQPIVVTKNLSSSNAKTMANVA